MIALDRVLCDCCGDDMGQILGGVPTGDNVGGDSNGFDHSRVGECREGFDI